MQLAVAQPNLQQAFGDNSLFSTLYGMNNQDAYQAANLQNLGQAAQEQEFQAQKQPLDLDALVAGNRHTNSLADINEAQVPGVAAKSRMDVRADQVDAAIPQDQKVKAAVSAMAAKMSDDEYKQLENHIWSGVYSPDPKVRATATAAIPMLKGIATERLKLQQEGSNSLAVARQQGQNQKDVMQMQIDAGRFNNHNLDFIKSSQLIKSLTGGFAQQFGAWQYKAREAKEAADNTDDSAEKKMLLDLSEKYAAEAQYAAAQDVASKQAAAQVNAAGKPDVGALGIAPVVNPASIQPNVPPNPLLTPTPPPAPQPTGGKIKMTDPSGKVWNVPKDKLDAARAKGWTPQ